MVIALGLVAFFSHLSAIEAFYYCTKMLRLQEKEKRKAAPIFLATSHDDAHL